MARVDPSGETLQTVASSVRRHLPGQPSRLIGRDQELAHLVAAVADPGTRLLTVTGPGGCGKTRLALEVATVAAPHFGDGAVLVELAPLRDSSMLVAVVADALDVQDVGARPLLEVVIALIERRSLLLLLDNFEHVLAAVPVLATLLESCPQLTILATSREPLHLRWEKRFPLAPLALPTPEDALDPERLGEVPACSLFIERARAVRPDFAVSATQAPAIAEICARLDGLPLALELAAARISVLSPTALLQRLQRRLDLRSSDVDRTHRHRGLREMLDWSYSLLSAEDQRLFRRLGVFAGSARLGAIAAICSDGPDDGPLLDQLTELVDKGLLQTRESDPAEPRFEMLEIIREYAWQQLATAGELADLRRRHAQFYATLMRRMETDWWTARMLAWADELERDLPNLRTALSWSLESDGDTAIGLNILSFPYFWDLRGHNGEARDWLDRLLGTVTETTPPLARARGLTAAAYYALMTGDADACQRLVQDAVPLARATGEASTIWLAVSALGHLLRHREGAAGEPYLREAYAVAKAAGYPAGLVGSPFVIGDCRRAVGDFEGARLLFEECLENSRLLQAPYGLPWAERGLGHLDWMTGAYAQAEAHLTRALQITLDMRYARSTADVLESLAWNAASAGQADRAARFLGAAQRARDSIGIGMQPAHRAPHDLAVDTSRMRLGEAAFASLFRQGQDTPMEELIEAPRGPRTHSEASPRLTAREQEVVRLLAQDFSNRQIAQALVIAERTAETHVTNILNKLNFTSRVEVRQWASSHGLVSETTD